MTPSVSVCVCVSCVRLRPGSICVEVSCFL